jgi:hypothetical protein
MNINMTLMQLAHWNFHFLIISIAYHTRLSLIKLIVVVIQVVHVQLRDVELVEAEILVEM